MFQAMSSTATATSGAPKWRAGAIAATLVLDVGVWRLLRGLLSQRR